MGRASRELLWLARGHGKTFVIDLSNYGVNTTVSTHTLGRFFSAFSQSVAKTASLGVVPGVSMPLLILIQLSATLVKSTSETQTEVTCYCSMFTENTWFPNPWFPLGLLYHLLSFHFCPRICSHSPCSPKDLHETACDDVPALPNTPQ